MGCLCSVLTLRKHQAILTLFMLGDAGVSVIADRGGCSCSQLWLAVIMPKDISKTWYSSFC